MLISTEAIFQFKSLTSFAFKWTLFSFRVFRPLILPFQYTEKQTLNRVLTIIPMECLDTCGNQFHSSGLTGRANWTRCCIYRIRAELIGPEQMEWMKQKQMLQRGSRPHGAGNTNTFYRLLQPLRSSVHWEDAPVEIITLANPTHLTLVLHSRKRHK